MPFRSGMSSLVLLAGYQRAGNQQARRARYVPRARPRFESLNPVTYRAALRAYTSAWAGR